MICNEPGRAALIIFFTFLLAVTATAKNVDDVIVLKNGDRLTGQIKGLQSGELRVKCDYMAEAVRLDWARVKRLESRSTFMIWLVDGKLLTDVMRLMPANSSEIPNFIIGSSEQTIRVPQLDVIRIAPADRRFWKLFDLLRSDQQSLKLRTTVGALVGRNVVQTEHTRLSVFGGAAGARENYSESIGTPKSTNADAIAGADFVTFRFSRTDIRSRFSLFPSLTTPGRTRLQATSDLRIKIVKDLWWGFHIYENFDSKPPVRADKNDLGVSTSLGWKF